MGAQHVLAVVREAAISDEVIEIRYHSFGKDEVAVRSIDPYSLHARDGHWYLLARCHQADALRHFRLDRILEASATGETFVRPDTEPAFEFELPSDMRKVVLDVPATSSWVTDTYPTVSAVTQANGRLLIEIESGSSAFLERLLLRLGADASATDSLSGESVLPVRAAAAKRILARYED
jgi:proteasome accessory factor C